MFQNSNISKVIQMSSAVFRLDMSPAQVIYLLELIDYLEFARGENQYL